MSKRDSILDPYIRIPKTTKIREGINGDGPSMLLWYNVEWRNAIYKRLELNYDVFDCCRYSGMIYIKFIYLVAHI